MMLAELIKKEGDAQEFKYEGFDCYILRNPTTLALSGYVRIPETHPLYGVNYYDQNYYFDVYGGVSYSESFLPKIGYDPGWYIGFDCQHIRGPLSECALLGYGPSEGAYLDMEFVKSELIGLVDQLIQIEEEY